MTPAEAIAAIVERLARDKRVRGVYLFGSRARGDAAPRSDIDIAADAPEIDQAGWLHLCDRVDEIETLLKIDLIRLDQASARLVRQVHSEGKKLYERSNNTA